MTAAPRRRDARRRAPRTPILRRLLAGGLRALPALRRLSGPTGLRRPALVAAGVAVALVAGAVTPPVVPSEAAWRDAEWMKSRVATENLTCGTSTGFTTTASARFLRGSLIGTNLDAAGSLAGLSAVDDARPGSQPTPASAPSPATGVYVNPLVAQALGTTATLDLTGLNAGLPAGSAGALNQYVRVTETGTSAAASGLVSNSGAVGVTGTPTSPALPGRATIDLDRVLASVNATTGTSALTTTRLALGAVASSSVLDWCSGRRNAVWGNGSLPGSTRQYGIAGLELTAVSPAVRGITGTTTTAATTGVTAAAALLTSGSSTTTPTGPVADAIRSAILSTLGSIGSTLGLTALTGTISVTGVDAAATAVAPLLTAPLRSADGSVAVDLATGVVTVDLAYLLGRGAGGLNGKTPNTEILVDAQTLNTVAASVGALIDQRSADIRAAMTTALQKVTVTVDVTANVTLQPLLGSPIPVLALRSQFSGTLADLVAGKQFTITATALNLGTLGSVVAGLLSALGLGSVTALGDRLVASLATGLVAPVRNAVTTGLAAPVTTLGTNLAAVSAGAVTGVGSVVNALPRVLSLQVNVRPDQPGAPAGSTYLPAVGRSTSAEYTVTALRLGLRVADAVTGTPFSVTELATSTAGRNAYRTP
ncbi:choice-of-anchor G family protein [Clavibacter sp. CT19]|uniref:choice-of-anchor G family protein n=1 Tax=Clavibacter sp. CT19 TaxID=3018990 RepID=UPI0022EAAD7B|nr:choice-of-anchor G family protein [Clavibacter sp. CT19]MDA3805243.1 choice-of-anchor G family protein [Clavibacter sp. CT19]